MKIFTNRNKIIDFYRGIAILLMILDHSLLTWQSRYGDSYLIEIIRSSLTRFSMPIFMILSGYLLSKNKLSIKRWSEVFIIAIFINSLTFIYWKEFNFPEILLLWCFISPFINFFSKMPIFFIILGFIQYEYFKIDYYAYQPGILILFLLIGYNLNDNIFNSAILDKVLKFKALYTIELIGRYPLIIYSTHIILLVFILNLF